MAVVYKTNRHKQQSQPCRLVAKSKCKETCIKKVVFHVTSLFDNGLQSQSFLELRYQQGKDLCLIEVEG